MGSQKFSIPPASPSFSRFGKLKKLNIHRNIKSFWFDFSGQVELNRTGGKLL
jgi:hypothetical protein